MNKSLENDDIRKKPFPPAKLWAALNATLDVFGPSMKEATISELHKSGLDPDRQDREYTLAEVGEKLHSIFGIDGTEVILDQIAKRLKSQDNNIA